MSDLPLAWYELDRRITVWMAAHGIALLRISIGIVFFWFGVLKFFPGLSSAELLAGRTIEVLSFGVVRAPVSLPILATWECIIGLGLISGKFMRAVILLLLVQMLGTLTPLLFFPRETFVFVPFVPTLEGQYILKNMVLISGALVVGATVRGGQIVADPRAAQAGKEMAGETR